MRRCWLLLLLLVAVAHPAFADDDTIKLDAGPKPPHVADMTYSAALGSLAAAGWKGPVVISNAGHMTDDVRCWDDGKSCLQSFYAPSGKNALQIVKELRPDTPYVAKYRLVPGQCACDDPNGDTEYHWIAAERVSWKKIGNELFFDPASKKTLPREVVNVDLMNDYKEVSSAQMFGLSDVENVTFFCSQSRFVSNSDKCYRDRMGKGPVTKVLRGRLQKPAPIPIAYLKAFAEACSP